MLKPHKARKCRKTIVVCSGADLMKTMNKLIKSFEERTGARVEVHYGRSAGIYVILTTTGCVRIWCIPSH